MSPGEKNVLRALVAVAWTDGKIEEGEAGVIEGLLSGFDASDEEEVEILAYARTRRTLEDIRVLDLTDEDRELLLSNAALITHVDGEQSDDEASVLSDLVRMLGFSPVQAEEIISATRDGVLNLGTKPLGD